MIKLVIVEGPDNAGKTTLIGALEESGATLIDFPKRTSSGLFKCESRNEVSIFETMLKYLKDGIYVLDRSYISNIVYEKLRGNSAEIYVSDLKRLMANFDVVVLGLTRNKIDFDFVDDNIKLSKSEFNDVIKEFNEVYSEFNILPIKILEHDARNHLVSVNNVTKDIIEKIMH